LVVIDVHANLGNSPREGTVTIHTGSADFHFIIRQGAGFGLVLETETWNPSFAGAGGLFYIHSNRQWGETMSPWLILHDFTPANRTGNGGIAVEARPNFGNAPRTGHITVSTTFGSPATTRRIDVTQGTGAVLISPTGDLPMPEHVFTVGPYQAESNRMWTATSSDTSWLTVTPTINTGNQIDTGLFNGSFTITTRTANIANTTRNGTITISAPGAPDRVIRVIQAAGNGLALSGNTWTAPSANASSASVGVTSDRTWTVRVRNDNDRWIRVTPASGTNNGTFRIEASANFGAARTGHVDVTAGSVTRTVTVTQPAGSVLWLSGTEGFPCPAGGIGRVNVVSNRQWNLSVVDTHLTPWLRIHDFNPPNRTGDGNFGILADENPGGERTGTIRVTASGLQETVRVVQERRTHNLTLTENGAPINFWNPPHIERHIDITVVSGANWTPHAIGTGLSVERISTDTTRAKVTRNTGSERTGTIIVNAPGAPTRTINVTQAGAGTLALSLPSWTPTSGASEATVEITTDRMWDVRISSSDTRWLNFSQINIINRTFEIRASANTTGAVRHGTITVFDGITARTIRVTQTLDPPLSERFMWNEEPNHWIMIRPAVQAAGGGTSWNTATSTMHVNVYGANVSFRLGNDGVREITGRGSTIADRIAVRADVFYNTVVNAVGQIAFLGVHEVKPTENIGSPWYHARVIVFARQGSNLLQVYNDYSVAYELRTQKFCTFSSWLHSIEKLLKCYIK
jgi:hypothetical protein